jgi:hypothetical protein
MNCFSFFLPHFPGAPKSERPLLPRRADALWEGPVAFGRNGKAESAKLPGAGIGPKQCPRKCAAEKGHVTEVKVRQPAPAATVTAGRFGNTSRLRKNSVQMALLRMHCSLNLNHSGMRSRIVLWSECAVQAFKPGLQHRS